MSEAKIPSFKEDQKPKSKWNPFGSVSFEKMRNESLGMKFLHTYYVFFGDIPAYEESVYRSYQIGLLDFIPSFFLAKFLLDNCRKLWGKANAEEFLVYSEEDATDTSAPTKSKPFMRTRLGAGIGIFLISLVMLPFLILQALLALALTILVSPIVILVDIFVGPNLIGKETEEDALKGNQLITAGKTPNINVYPALTPVRHSFWFNPSTWAAFAALIAYICNFISLESASPMALASLGVIQAVCTSMAVITLAVFAVRFAGEMAVVGYRKATQEKTDAPNQYTKDLKILNYLSDRLAWMKNYPGYTIVMSVPCGIWLGFALGITLAFFIGVPPDSFITHIFSGTAGIIGSIIEAMSHLPGLGFFAMSDAILVPIVQILTVASFIAPPLFVLDSALRFGQTWLKDSTDPEEGSMCKVVMENHSNSSTIDDILHSGDGVGVTFDGNSMQKVTSYSSNSKFFPTNSMNIDKNNAISKLPAEVAELFCGSKSKN